MVSDVPHDPRIFVLGENLEPLIHRNAQFVRHFPNVELKEFALRRLVDTAMHNRHARLAERDPPILTYLLGVYSSALVENAATHLVPVFGGYQRIR